MNEPIIIPFHANDLLRSIEGRVEFYSYAQYERMCQLLNGLIDYSSLGFPTYYLIGHSQFITDDNLFTQQDLNSIDVGIVIRGKNIYEYIESINQILTEVLDTVENCDVPNMVDLIQEYIPSKGSASYFLDIKQDLNTHKLTDVKIEDFRWGVEINGTYKSSGKPFTRYQFDNDIFSIDEINILLNINNDEENIDSVYLVFRDYYTFNKIEWRSKDPLDITESICQLELEKIRLKHVIEKRHLLEQLGGFVEMFE
jgi:hypothetical protein